MAKYSYEFKLEVVKDYLDGSSSYVSLAKKYGIPNCSPIKHWVNAYKGFGKDGLREKNFKAVYSVKFKVKVLQFMKQTSTSYRDTAIEFKLNNPSLIANWKRIFLKEGIEGLKPKPKGRSPMPKNRKVKPPKQEQAISREEQLEHENELLRLEIAYLKKLNAFQENPNAFLEKHKQRWHSNSKKKDSD